MSGTLAATVARFFPEAENFLRDLVAMNSFTGNAEGVESNAERILRQFEPLGWRPERAPCRLAGTGRHLLLDSTSDRPVVLLVSHLDTVYLPAEQEAAGPAFVREGGRVRGPGVYDIKGGTAMLWLVLRVLREIDPDAWNAVRWVAAWRISFRTALRLWMAWVPSEEIPMVSSAPDRNCGSRNFSTCPPLRPRPS